MTDDIDFDEIRDRIDYWIRIPGRNDNAIHVPDEDSSRKDLSTPCRFYPRKNKLQDYDLSWFTDDDLEDRMCGDCARKCLDLEDGDDQDPAVYGRSPADVLADAGLEPKPDTDADDREVTAR